jgi:hypothetical protein
MTDRQARCRTGLSYGLVVYGLASAAFAVVAYQAVLAAIFAFFGAAGAADATGRGEPRPGSGQWRVRKRTWPAWIWPGWSRSAARALVMAVV